MAAFHHFFNSLSVRPLNFSALSICVPILSSSHSSRAFWTNCVLICLFPAGLSTAVQSGYRGASAVTYAGQGAMRNALGFGSWTCVYGFSRCGLIRARGRDDMLNAAGAGAFTGGLLTLISMRGYWRYNQSAIATNAAASAMIAVMFHALNQM